MGVEAAASDPAVGVGAAHHQTFPRPRCPPAQAGMDREKASRECQHCSPVIASTFPREEHNQYLLLLLTVSPEPIPGKWDLSEGTNQPAHAYWAVIHPA